MSYVKTNWKDHVLSNNNYTLKNNTDGTYSINPAGDSSAGNTDVRR